MLVFRAATPPKNFTNSKGSRSHLPPTIIWVVATQICFGIFIPTWGNFFQFDCCIFFQMGWWKTTNQSSNWGAPGSFVGCRVFPDSNFPVWGTGCQFTILQGQKKHGHHRLEGGMWSSCQSSFFWKQREKWDLGNFLTEKISGKCMRHDFSELLSPCKIVLDCFSHGNGQVWSLHVTMSDMDMAMESRLKFVHHWAG